MHYFAAVLMLTLSSSCMAAKSGEYALKQVSPKTFEKLASLVQVFINKEDTKLEAQPFDILQTFSLFDRNTQKGIFIPVKFNSNQYNNTICRLYFFDMKMHISQINLLAEKSEEGDIVPNCIGVESVSIEKVNATKLLFLSIVRYRLANQYSSLGTIVSYDSGILKAEYKLNKCIAQNGNVSKMQALKKRANVCQNSK